MNNPDKKKRCGSQRSKGIIVEAEGIEPSSEKAIS